MTSLRLDTRAVLIALATVLTVGALATTTIAATRTVADAGVVSAATESTARADTAQLGAEATRQLVSESARDGGVRLSVATSVAARVDLTDGVTFGYIFSIPQSASAHEIGT